MLRLYSSEIDFHTHYLARLATEACDGFGEALARLAVHGSRFSGLSSDEIRASQPTLDDALEVGAREHGFDSWTAFELHCKAIAEGTVEEPSIAFFHAVESSAVDEVIAALEHDPALVNAIASTGKAPLHKATSAAMVEVLIAHGANPELQVMLPGGTGILHAIIWGFTGVVDAIGQVSKAPGNLRVAAGLGDLGMIDSLFDDLGNLRAEARAERAYYRPNYGWYPWQSHDDEQEVLDEGLILAATNGRIEAMQTLVNRGANVNGKAYETTALVRAAWRNQIEAVDWLLTQNAAINEVGWLGGHAQGVTALHMVASNGYDDVAELLVARGGDRTLKDPLYGANAAGWARHGGFNALADRLQAR